MAEKHKAGDETRAALATQFFVTLHLTSCPLPLSLSLSLSLSLPPPVVNFFTDSVINCFNSMYIHLLGWTGRTEGKPKTHPDERKIMMMMNRGANCEKETEREREAVGSNVM